MQKKEREIFRHVKARLMIKKYSLGMSLKLLKSKNAEEQKKAISFLNEAFGNGDHNKITNVKKVLEIKSLNGIKNCLYHEDKDIKFGAIKLLTNMLKSEDKDIKQNAFFIAKNIDFFRFFF